MIRSPVSKVLTGLGSKDREQEKNPSLIFGLTAMAANGCKLLYHRSDAVHEFGIQCATNRVWNRNCSFTKFLIMQGEQRRSRLNSRLKVAWGLLSILGWSWSGQAAPWNFCDGLAGWGITQSIITAHTGKASLFHLDATVTVPDGGSTVALLGVVLLGMECLRRRTAK